jgi:hypothetical protein
MHMVRRLDKLWVTRHRLTVRIACDIDACQIPLSIEENIEFNAARAITEIECHRKHASAAPLCWQQGLQA